MWVDEQSAYDGSVVLGGYDRDKVIGENYTQPLDFSNGTGCWTGMKVTIESVKLNFREGADYELLDSSTAIEACLVPQRQLLLEAPGSIISNFAYYTGMESEGRSFGLHWSAFLYNGTTKWYDGDITFGLTTGFEVRIPNSQFLVPYVEMAENGSRTIDKSRRELLINGVADQPATLGRYFFTAAYLMVDLDEGTYTLWKANPTTRSTLVSVIGPNTRAQCGNDSVSGNPTGGEGHDPPSTESMSSPSRKLSSGAISGVTIGSVTAVGLLVGFLFCTWRSRRRRDGHPKPNETTTAQQPGHLLENQLLVKPSVNPSLPTQDNPQELDASQQPVSELEGSASLR